MRDSGIRMCPLVVAGGAPMMYFRNEVISRAGMRPLTCLLFACLPLLLLLASPAQAQVYTGSITGLIQDPSGAVVPNASVVLTDTTKGLKYSATTDSSVRYGAAQSAAEHI